MTERTGAVVPRVCGHAAGKELVVSHKIGARATLPAHKIVKDTGRNWSTTIIVSYSDSDTGSGIAIASRRSRRKRGWLGLLRPARLDLRLGQGGRTKAHQGGSRSGS